MADVDVLCALDRVPAQYALQEDVLLQVKLTNRGGVALATPYLLQSDDVKLRLKGPAADRLREQVTLVPRPGIALSSDVYSLAAGQDVSYSLLLSTWFGPLGPGDYEVQLEINSNTVAYISPWLNLNVAGAAFDHPAVVPVAAGTSSEFSLLWIDRGANPPKLLCRTLDLKRGIASMTVALTDATSDCRGITAAMAPPGMQGDLRWVIWLDGGELKYTLKEEREWGAVYSSPLPERSKPIGPALGDPDPDTDETGFSLLLLSEDSPAFLGVEVEPGGSVVTTHRMTLDGTPDHVALAYAAADSRWVVWSRTDSRKVAFLYAMSWDRVRGFGETIEIGEVQAPIWALDAKAREKQLWVSALIVADELDASGSTRRVGHLATVHCVLSPGEVKAQAPAIMTVAIAPDVTDARLCTSENGSPWLLLRHPVGQRVLGCVEGVFTESFDVRVKTLDAWLTVDENEVPRVILLDALKGWDLRVAVPDAGSH